METISIANGLPHRFPFVLVDRIVEIEYRKRSKGYKNVSFNELWAVGHFPSEPIYPGVLMIETMAQVGGFIFYNQDEENKAIKLYLCAVNQIKILHPVKPGDVLSVESELTDSFGKFHQLKCIAKVEDAIVASGGLTLAESE